MVRVYLGRKATLSCLSLFFHPLLPPLLLVVLFNKNQHLYPSIDCASLCIATESCRYRKKRSLEFKAKKLWPIIQSFNGGSVLEKKKEVGGLGKESRRRIQRSGLNINNSELLSGLTLSPHKTRNSLHHIFLY